jgi:hypothetical protein
MPEQEYEYAYASTRATKMFAKALTDLHERHGISQRKFALQAGYKSSVVISHMASGRTPIPINRGEDFAKRLQIPKRDFMVALLEQRHPDIDWMRTLYL